MRKKEGPKPKKERLLQTDIFSLSFHGGLSFVLTRYDFSFPYYSIKTGFLQGKRQDFQSESLYFLLGMACCIPTHKKRKWLKSGFKEKIEKARKKGLFLLTFDKDWFPFQTIHWKKTKQNKKTHTRRPLFCQNQVCELSLLLFFFVKQNTI